MILKCAQHISLPERSHPPKLIKNYIAISCLIKATLCSENPAQLSNGCYSMKAGRICLRERCKTHAHTQTKHIIFPAAHGDRRRPRSAAMEKAWNVERVWKLETARLSLWQSARSHSLAWGFIDCRIGSDSGEWGLIATFCVVTSTLSSWTWPTADSWSVLHRFSWGRLGDLPIQRLANLRTCRAPESMRERPPDKSKLWADVSWRQVQVAAPPAAVYPALFTSLSEGLSCD